MAYDWLSEISNNQSFKGIPPIKKALAGMQERRFWGVLRDYCFLIMSTP